LHHRSGCHHSVLVLEPGTLARDGRPSESLILRRRASHCTRGIPGLRAEISCGRDSKWGDRANGRYLHF
jgi:hypothetical protein